MSSSISRVSVVLHSIIVTHTTTDTVQKGDIQELLFQQTSTLFHHCFSSFLFCSTVELFQIAGTQIKTDKKECQKHTLKEFCKIQEAPPSAIALHCYCCFWCPQNFTVQHGDSSVKEYTLIISFIMDYYPVFKRNMWPSVSLIHIKQMNDRQLNLFT